jgi:hypothetical protein
VCGATFALLSAARIAGAQSDSAAADLPLELEWSAPEGCPSQSDVLTRVRGLLGEHRSAERPVTKVKGAVRQTTAHDGTGAELVLETHVTRQGATPLSGRRTLAGATCDEVTSAGALVIALAIDPEAVTEEQARVETPAEAAPATKSDTTPDTAPPAPTPPAPAPVNVAPPANRATAGGPSADGMIAARVALDVGSLPAPALGFFLAGGFAVGRLRAELAAGYFLPRFAAAPDGTGATENKGADVSLPVADVRGCYALVPGRLTLDGCLAMEAGALVAVGEGFDRSTTSVSPWLAAEAALAIAYRARPSLSFGASAGALVPFGRSHVRFSDETADGRIFTEFHQPSVASLRLGLDARLSFP